MSEWQKNYDSFVDSGQISSAIECCYEELEKNDVPEVICCLIQAYTQSDVSQPIVNELLFNKIGYPGNTGNQVKYCKDKSTKDYVAIGIEECKYYGSIGDKDSLLKTFQKIDSIVDAASYSHICLQFKLFYATFS